MMHLTVLVSLLTVAICSETTILSEPNSESVTTTSASHFSSSLATSPFVKTSPITPLSPTTTTTTTTTITTTTTHQSTTDVTSASSSAPRTEEPFSVTTANIPTSQVSNGTTVQETVSTSESQNVTGSTNVNTTSPALSTNQAANSLAENPGLVAIICIFSIVLALMMVVGTVKCIQSPTSNFERLEDVPMGKVNEESPFAHYSK